MTIENAESWVMPSSPADKTKINSALEEIVNSLVRQSAESDHIKEIKKLLKEEFDMPPKVVNRFARTIYNHNLEQQRVADDAFYESFVVLRGIKDADEDQDEGDDE
jgi:YesN/AraC family two-component response regulator